MKKLIVILFIFILASIFLHQKKQIIIPNTAIRFRIIANSNEKEDQKLKYEIKNAIEPDLMSKLSNSNSIEEARENIKNYIPQAEETISLYTNDYKINYGNNYFPEKVYKGVTYEAGEYESLVVTLGNGLGENWWCVLFPPLCLLEAEENEISDTEYRFYVADIINKIMN